MTRRAQAHQDGTKGSGVHPHHRGFGSRVQNALGCLAPKSWGVGTAAGHPANPSSPKQHHHNHSSLGDFELGPRQSTTSSNGTDAGPAFDAAAGCSSLAGELSRPQTGSISHISSAGSLAAATNDANSVASGSSSLPGRHSSTNPAQQQHAGLGLGFGLGFSTQPDDMCSLATQAGSTAHSFTSLASTVTTGHGDVSSDGCGSLIPAGPAPAPAASSEKAGGGLTLSTSPTAAGSSTLSMLSAFRSSDAGGDAASVSTLPLISETGLDEGPSRAYEDGLLEVATLAEEHEQEHDQHPGGSSEGGAPDRDPSLSDSMHPKPRISSSHGSYTSLASNTSELSGSGPGPNPAAVAAARMPSPAQGRMTHGQRSGSRHSFQQQLQQQLLQDLEESQEEEGVDGLPLPFSTRRRPDNDDMCSYATQAGSSVHSLSSVMSSHMDSTQQQQQQRPHLSSDGSRSFSSLQQAAANRSSRRSSGGHTPAMSPGLFAGSSYSAAASPVTSCGDGGDGGGSSIPGSPSCGMVLRGVGASTAAGLSEDGVHGQQSGLQRKGSLKGAFKAVTRWGSGISQRLQRTGSGPQQQHHHQQQHQYGMKQGSLQGGDVAAAAGSSGGQELAALPRPATQ